MPTLATRAPTSCGRSASSSPRKDRIDANLSHLVAMLDGLPTKVVHMRALDSAAADQLSGDMAAELAAVGHELRTSEEVMKAMGEL